MPLFSAIATAVMAVAAAVAIELRRVTEVQVAVAEHRSADATARGQNGS